MKIESALKHFSPKSLQITDSPRATKSDSLTGTDIMASLGFAEQTAGFGMALVLAKNDISNHDKVRAVESLNQYALTQVGKYKSISKLDGKVRRKVVQLLAMFAYQDYSRSAATPGARCKDCHGTGRAIDREKTEQWARPVEKECDRCTGKGYRRMPSSAAFRAVCVFIPELSQSTWSRSIKPLYDALVAQCYKEESMADAIFDSLTK